MVDALSQRPKGCSRGRLLRRPRAWRGRRVGRAAGGLGASLAGIGDLDIYHCRCGSRVYSGSKAIYSVSSDVIALSGLLVSLVRVFEGNVESSWHHENGRRRDEVVSLIPLV